MKPKPVTARSGNAQISQRTGSLWRMRSKTVMRPIRPAIPAVTAVEGYSPNEGGRRRRSDTKSEDAGRLAEANQLSPRRTDRVWPWRSGDTFGAHHPPSAAAIERAAL